MLPIHKINQARTKTFKLTGGLNTEVASMEKPPGELSVCLNYVEREGSYSGYQSVGGYERYDGQTLASSIARETYTEYAGGPDSVLNDRVFVTVGGDDLVFYCIQASGSGSNAPDSGTPGDNTWWKYEGLVGVVNEYEDRKREAQRALITAVPGAGATRGIHIYINDVYAWRDDATSSFMDLYKESGSGWTKVTTGGMTVPGGDVRAVSGRFSKYNSNETAMFWVDGVTDGVHVYNGTTYSQITSGLPVGNAPVNVGVWENRLFVVFDDGNILFSQVGQPDNFDSSTGYAGNIDMGDPVTGVIPAAGVLLLFTRKGIKVLHYGSTTDQFIFKLDDFSKNMGAVDKTVQNLFEKVYFADDRGPSQMIPAAETGGFQADHIGEKVETEYNANKDNITGSVIDIINRRYYIFYTVSGKSNGLAFTFNKGKLKGIGRFEFQDKATVSAHGVTDDGTPRMLFGDDSGYIFLMESGTSFDGESIETRFVTSYYHYGSPRHWKHFARLHFEIDCGSQMPFTVGALYDYGSPLLAESSEETQNVSGGSSVWGGGVVWGEFTWGAGVLGRGIAYIHGYGANMGIVVKTDEKYFSKHTVHNITTDYQQGSIQQ
jgi:hypothetical protein